MKSEIRNEIKINNFQSSDNEVIWSIIQDINRAWYDRNLSNLEAFFHNDIIFNSPDFKSQIKGKAPCIKTYSDFIKGSEVLRYQEREPNIQINDKTAIATYEFEMHYKQNRKTFHETGVDILVFNKIENIWKVVWRGMSNLTKL